MLGKRKKAWLNKNIDTFIREYSRKAQRGVEPNDRKYDRKIEEIIKNMDPEELSSLISGSVETSPSDNKQIPARSNTAIALKIISWSGNSWSAWSGQARSMLTNRIHSVVPNMRITEIKRLARAILRQECSAIILPDSANLESMRHFLESIGAKVEIEGIIQK